jgi:glycosyltransferase involved in cell wall biosynthesis
MVPLVTVIMPVYNGSKWVENAIDSVLVQSFSNFEFIIINDCSIDNTREIILKFKDSRIKYFENELNLGVQKTRNLALIKVQGEYIAEIDQDDEWIDINKLQKQVDFLFNNSDYALVGSGVILIGNDGRELTRFLMPSTDQEIRSKMLRANPFIHSSVMFRANDVKLVGGYSVGKMSEDHDLWLRLGKVGKLHNFNEFSVKYLYSTSGYNSQDKIKRLMQNIEFAHEFKDFYPDYHIAILSGWIKILSYPLFNLLPIKFRGFFLRLHKKLLMSIK